MITYKKYCISWLKKTGYFSAVLEYVKRHKIGNNSISSYFDNVRPENFIIQLIPIKQGTYEPNDNTYEFVLLNKITEIYNYWLIELYKLNPNYGFTHIKSAYRLFKYKKTKTIANLIIEFIVKNQRLPTEEEQKDLKKIVL